MKRRKRAESFEKTALRKLCGFEVLEATEDSRKLRKEKLHDFYFSPDVFG
jgi:hypothetical protein